MVVQSHHKALNDITNTVNDIRKANEELRDTVHHMCRAMQELHRQITELTPMGKYINNYGVVK